MKKLIPINLFKILDLKHHFNSSMPPRLLYEDIVKIFESKGCQLISKTYVSNKKPLDYICSCGSKTIHKITLCTLQSGIRCKDCRKERLKKTNLERFGYEYVSQRPEKKESALKGIRKHIAEKKHTLEELKEIYKKAGCVLLTTEYKDNKALLEFRCKCGKIGKNSFNKFHKGQRCSDNTCMDTRKKQTMIEKFGAISYTGTDEYNIRRSATCLERYGTEFAAQCNEVQDKIEKSCHRFKIYTFPSGRQEKVQGYEPFGLNYLLKTYNESDIVLGRSNQPEIWYYLPNDDNIHRYFSDIYIPKDNHIIEIKSTYTYTKGNKQGKLKPQEAACKTAGYKYTCLVFDDKGILQPMHSTV